MRANKISFDDRVKPKNVLALNEKVAAIRRYETDPVYKRVGRYFNCSPDQIKRIIKQKNEILAEWDNRTKKSVVPTSHEVKSVKMSFLGKAVHEWIRRMMYYTDFNLTNALIQTMAIEFKKVLGLQNFFPDKLWIANFRNTYGLKEVNTKTLDIGYQESLSVQIRDILRSETLCASDNAMDTQQLSSFTLKEEPRNECHSSSEEVSVPSCSFRLSVSERKSFPVPIVLPPTIKVKVVPARPPRPAHTLLPTELVEIDTVKTEVKEEQPEQEQPKFAINTQDEAISCVKLLEEFALLQENFRLIGLVERLEEALKGKK